MSERIDDIVRAHMSPWQRFIAWWNNGGTKWVQGVVGWALLLGSLGLVGYVVARFLTFSGPEWQVYVNATFAQSVLRIVIVGLVLFMCDAVTKGKTLISILECNSDSPWQDKAVTAGFLLGLGYLTLSATKGGMIGQ